MATAARSGDQGRQRQSVGLLLDAIELGDANGDVETRERKIHLMGHERAEPGETEVVAVGLVEHILRCIEGVDGQALLGGNEGKMLQAWKAEHVPS